MENTAPGWWQVSLADITGQAESKGYTGDGANGSMTFTLKGLKLTKSDGTSGTFKFDMTQITKEGWSIGKLYTSGVNVLMGILVNNGNAVVDEYNILTLNDEKLVLCAPEPGAGDWGTGWFWCFKAKN